MHVPSSLKRSLLGLVGAVALSAALVAPTMAAPITVTQVITGAGGLDASIASASMQPVQYSNSNQTSTGLLTLSAADPRGTSQGWNVTVQSTDFIWQGSLSNTNAHDIPATGFLLTSADAPTAVAGQTVDSAANHGPLVPSGAAGALSSARMPIQSFAGYGSGDYSQSLNVSLAIPAQSQVGIYQAVLTVIISSGP